MILKADSSLFGRIIILGQNRKTEVRELLHYSLGPLQWVLATPEGFPRKTNTAALATYLTVYFTDRECFNFQSYNFPGGNSNSQGFLKCKYFDQMIYTRGHLY